MKRMILVCLALAAAVFAVQAEALFVTAKVCPLLADAKAGSKLVASLPQGTKLELTKADGDWRLVKAGDKKGWVQKMFVGSSPSMAQVQQASNVQDIAALVERRRASSYETSAAATRGLTSSPRGRENLAFAAYDFTASRWINSLTVPAGAPERLAAAIGLLASTTVQ